MTKKPTTHVASAAVRRQGFTFLEMVVILGLIALLVTFSIPSLEGLAPKYRLRTAARRIASQLEYVRVAAISRERWMGLRYGFEGSGADDRPYYQVIPPAPDDDPHQPVEERQLQSKKALPPGVVFARVVLSDSRTFDRDTVDVFFSPTGNVGSHIVILEGQNDRVVSLKFNCITGILEFSESADAAFEHFED